MKLVKSSSKLAFRIMKQSFNFALQPKTWKTALLGVVSMVQLGMFQYLDH
jgi:hypothetical protein